MVLAGWHSAHSEYLCLCRYLCVNVLTPQNAAHTKAALSLKEIKFSEAAI